MTETMSNSDASRRMLPNIISNLVFMLANFALGLLLVPYYLDTLGVAAYAIIPVATSVTSYVVLLSDSLSSTVSRYITIEVNSDTEAARMTFNTAVRGFSVIVLCAIPVVLLISAISPSVFDISTNTVQSVQALFVLILASVLVNVWSNNFITAIYSKNRIDLTNVIKTIQVVLQVVFIILFFTFARVSVSYVGLAYLLASMVYLILSVVVAHRISPEIWIGRGLFDRARFREMTSVSGWALVNSLGNLLFIQASLLLVNVLMGAEQGGLFGVMVMVVSAVSALMDTLATVFTPTVYRLYSEGRIEDMNRMVILAVKVVGVVMAMPIAFLAVFSDQILTLWVGPEYTSLSEMVLIAMVAMLCIGSITPSYPLTMVHLKIKVPGLMTFMFGALNVVLAVAVMEFTDLGLEGVMAVWALTMILKNVVFNTRYAEKVSGMDGHQILRSMMTGYLVAVVLWIVYSVISAVIHLPDSWMVMIFAGVVLLGVHSLFILRFVFRDGERDMIMACMPNVISKLLKKVVKG